MNFGKAPSIFTVILLVLASNIAVIAPTLRVQSTSIQSTLPTKWPSVYVYPETVIANVGDTFTVAVVVFNLTNSYDSDPNNPLVERPLGNLYGFDIQIAWNKAILRYVSHTVTVPVETYPNPVPPSPYAGVLRDPVFKLIEEVDEDANIPGSEPGTMFWVGYSSMSYPAKVSNGNGTFFIITFNVTSPGSSAIKFTGVALANNDARPLLFHSFDGEFRTEGAPTADFTFWPDVGVVGKPVIFNASESYDPEGSIASYNWNFGDGNITEVSSPIIHHSYVASRDYTVSLMVMDSDGIYSSERIKTIRVVSSRDIKLNFITLTPSDIVRVNRTVDVAILVENTGATTDEKFTLMAYYNASSVDLDDISATDWRKIDEAEVLLTSSGANRIKTQHMTWNTTGVQAEAHYYVFANATFVPYEAKTEDNDAVSQPVFVTAQEVHDVVVTTLQFGWNAAGSTQYLVPVIDGETTSFRIVVKNQGTEKETAIDVNLYSNDSVLKNWVTQLEPGMTIEFKHSESLNPNAYNITAEAAISNDDNPLDNKRQGILRVIGTPSLSFTFTPSPESIYVNQTVSISALASFHKQAGASITNYAWEIWKAGASFANYTSQGSDLVSINFTFVEEGDWRVILNVKDSNGIEYNRFRTATSVYRHQFVITVKEVTGFPIEYIAAIAIVVAIVIAFIFILYRRRRHAKA